VPLSDERAVPDANLTNPNSRTNKGPELTPGPLGTFEIRFQETSVAEVELGALNRDWLRFRFSVRHLDNAAPH